MRRRSTLGSETIETKKMALRHRTEIFVRYLSVHEVKVVTENSIWKLKPKPLYYLRFNRNLYIKELAMMTDQPVDNGVQIVRFSEWRQ